MIALLLALQLTTAIPAEAIRPLTLKEICTTRWSVDRRHVTPAMKRAVLQQAGIPWAERRRYEIDHKIARAIGGADVLINLQPQLWPIAYQKDADERRLFYAVCDGRMDLDAARLELWNWRPK